MSKDNLVEVYPDVIRTTDVTVQITCKVKHTCMDKTTGMFRISFGCEKMLVQAYIFTFSAVSVERGTCNDQLHADGINNSRDNT